MSRFGQDDYKENVYRRGAEYRYGKPTKYSESYYEELQGKRGRGVSGRRRDDFNEHQAEPVEKDTLSNRILGKLCSKYSRKQNFRVEKAHATVCNNVKYDSAVFDGEYRIVKGGVRF